MARKPRHTNSESEDKGMKIYFINFIVVSSCFSNMVIYLFLLSGSNSGMNLSSESSSEASSGSQADGSSSCSKSESDADTSSCSSKSDSNTVVPSIDTSSKMSNRQKNRSKPFNPDNQEVIELLDDSSEEDSSSVVLPVIPRKSLVKVKKENISDEVRKNSPSSPDTSRIPRVYRNELQAAHRMDPLLTRSLPPDDDLRTGIRYDKNNQGTVYTR